LKKSRFSDEPIAHALRQRKSNATTNAPSLSCTRPVIAPGKRCVNSAVLSTASATVNRVSCKTLPSHDAPETQRTG
jgi:hypothetical protein